MIGPFGFSGRDVTDVASRGLCTGCGLCEAMAGAGKIEVTRSDGGYLRPRLKARVSKPVMKRIMAVCPGVRIGRPRSPARVDRLWGPIMAVKAGHATDPALRFAGSSGGAISAVAKHLLSTGAVDAVVTNSADPDNPIGNRTLVLTDPDDVARTAGSRYAPSAPLKDIVKTVEAHRRICFIGKPCDVAALRRLSARDRRIAERVTYYVAFFCAGIPSEHGAAQVVEALGFRRDEVRHFRFRGNGWPGMARAETIDGRHNEMSYNDSWGTILNRHLQFRCKICPDGIGESADLVAFDPWETTDGYPDFEERDGVSGVIARTRTGMQLLSDLEGKGALETEPLALDRLVQMQPYQAKRKRATLARLLGLFSVRHYTPGFYRMRLLWNALPLKRGNINELRATRRRCQKDEDREWPRLGA